MNDIINLQHVPDGMTITKEGDFHTLTTYKVPLKHVLHNFLSNAIKHHDTPQNGNVVIRSHIAKKKLKICVIDDGPGIPSQHQERVFELFKTLESQDKTEGSGLGLSIVLRLLKRFDGKIELKSPINNGRGTAFEIAWLLGD